MFILLNIHGYSQLSLVSRNGLATSGYMGIDDIWDLTITNNTDILYLNTSIEIVLSNDNGPVYHAWGSTITVPGSATLDLSKSSLKSVKANFVNLDFNTKYDSLQVIPSGNYIICYTIYSEKDSLSLCNYCKNLNITNIFDKEKKKKSIIESTGFMQLSAYTAFGNDTLPRNPGNYYMWRGSPVVQVADIPVRADFQFNILNNQIDYNTTYFNYVFDGDKYRDNLKKSAEKELKNRIKKYDKYSAVYEKAKNELISINTTLNNPAIQKELQQIALRDSLKKLLEVKLAPLQDTLAALKANDTLQKQNNTDSLLQTYPMLKDTLSLDSLLSTINADTSLLHKLPNADTLRQLITTYKKLDFIKDKSKMYSDLLLKKEKLGILFSKADSLKKTIPNNGVSVAKPSKIKQLLAGIQTLSWGTHVNTTSEFTCYGIPVTGLNFATGNTGVIMQYTNATQANNLLLNTNKYFKRQHTVYGLGWGNDEKWKFKLIYYSAEDKKAVRTLPTDSIDMFGPALNRIISAVTKVNVTPGIVFESEIAGSETVKNKLLYSVANAAYPTAQYNPGLGKSIQNIFARNNNDYNRYVGYAAKFNISASIKATRSKITVGVKRTGKNFTTYGNPMLFNNTLIIDSKLTQTIYRNNIKLGILFKYNNFYNDTVANALKSFYQYGVDLIVNFNKYPTLRLLYMPTAQIVSAKPIILNTLNAVSTYSYTLFTKQNMITATALIQSTGNNPTNNYYLKTTAVTVYNITRFSKNFTANSKYSYNKIKVLTINNAINTLELGCNYTYFKRNVQVNAALTLNKSTNDRKLGGSIEIHKPLNDIFSFSLRAERNTYNNYVNNPLYPEQYNFPSYSEWLLNASLNLKW